MSFFRPAFFGLVIAFGCGSISAQLAPDEARAGFVDAYQAQDWPRATEFAEIMVDRVAVAEGERSAAMLQPLLYLTGAAYQADLPDKVVAATERALAILAAQRSPDAAQILEFHWFQGKARAALGDINEANQAYYSALDASEELRPRDYTIVAAIWDDLLESAKRGDDVYNKGNYAASQALQARERQFGKNSPELIEGLGQYASWLRYSSQWGKERAARERIIDIIDRHYGPRDYRMGPQLRAIAQSYMYRNRGEEQAVAAITRALELYFPDTPAGTYELGRVTASWADLHVVYLGQEDASAIYSSAWRIMADSEDLGVDFANKYFEKPRRLFLSWPDQPMGSRGENYFGRGHVVMQFDVTAKGLLSNIELVEASRPDIDRAQFYRVFERARYRPRVLEGAAVATVAMKLRNSYDWSR